MREGPGWPYYARPRRGGQPPAADDVREVAARQRFLGVPESFEWIDEITPSMRQAAISARLVVTDHPLMVLTDESALERRRPPGVELRVVRPDDDVATIASVAAVAFSHPGTAVGTAGADELRQRAAERTAELDTFERGRLRSGAIVLVVAVENGTPVASGIHLPLGDVTEVAGVGTLPAFRRRGLGAAVTAFLAQDARARGLSTIFLSAGDEEIARLYGGIGFTPVGTACAAGG